MLIGIATQELRRSVDPDPLRLPQNDPRRPNLGVPASRFVTVMRQELSLPADAEVPIA